MESHKPIHSYKQLINEIRKKLVELCQLSPELDIDLKEPYVSKTDITISCPPPHEYGFNYIIVTTQDYDYISLSYNDNAIETNMDEQQAATILSALKNILETTITNIKTCLYHYLYVNPIDKYSNKFLTQIRHRKKYLSKHLALTHDAVMKTPEYSALNIWLHTILSNHIQQLQYNYLKSTSDTNLNLIELDVNVDKYHIYIKSVTATKSPTSFHLETTLSEPDKNPSPKKLPDNTLVIYYTGETDNTNNSPTAKKQDTRYILDLSINYPPLIIENIGKPLTFNDYHRYVAEKVAKIINILNKINKLTVHIKDIHKLIEKHTHTTTTTQINLDIPLNHTQLKTINNQNLQLTMRLKNNDKSYLLMIKQKETTTITIYSHQQLLQLELNTNTLNNKANVNGYTTNETATKELITLLLNTMFNELP